MKKQTPVAAAAHRDREPAGATETYRQMLVDKRADVLATLGVKFDTLARMGRVAEEDQAQITHDEFVSLHLNSIDYVQLRLVDEALDRLSSGDYGVCQACEEPIPAKRLRALPWARYCITCQETVGTQMDRDWAETRPRQPVAPAAE
ncbi:MAG TPA: TraR/DksA family transcriptional regulator [Bryobacteraceae bacterium]